MKYLIFIFLGLPLASFSQKAATIKKYRQSFTTYPYSDPNPLPSFTKIYPYFRYDGFTDKPIKKEWTVVELENDFIKVLILPEIGGKVWTAIEKSTGQPFIYFNHVIKFRDVAMRGPWTSGGIEANYGIFGHTPNCSTPVDYTMAKNADGSVSCVIGVLDLLTRTPWRVEINLPKDKACFTTKSIWFNASSISQPYYHWMNAGLKAAGNLEFLYQGNHWIGHEGEYGDWPVNKERDREINWYNQNDFTGYHSYHVFGKYTDYFGGYWHNDDLGMIRYADHDAKAGKKIWIWGLSDYGMLWEKLLTDNDGQYVELQSGRLFNQSAEKSTFSPFKHKNFSPYNTDLWTEYWYPIKGTKGVVEANQYGALNLVTEGDQIKVYFSPVQYINDELVMKYKGRIIYSKKLQLSPLQTFADSFRLKVEADSITVVLGNNKLAYNNDSSSNVLSRPIDQPADFNWNNAYGLYIQGKELMDQRLYKEAEPELKESLRKEPYFLPAIVQYAELLYYKMQYADALAYAKKALSIDTYDGAANYYYGLINQKLNNETDAKDGFDIATLSVEYRVAAYSELAKMLLRKKEADQAIKYADKALDYNRYDLAAYEIKAIAFRLKNEKEKSIEQINTLLRFDPLNHFAHFEKYVWNPTTDNFNSFRSFIQNEQPDQTWLELATAYYNYGCNNEAIQLLQAMPQNPLGEYFLAWLYQQRGKSFKDILNKANATSVDFIFPFRSEMEPALQWASKQTDSWKPKFFLALLYQSRNRTEESSSYLIQCGDLPDAPVFYATKASVLKDENELADLQKALSFDQSNWRYNKMLVEYFVGKGQYKQAAVQAVSFYANHPQNYIMGLLCAKALMLDAQLREADKVLTGLNLIPFEGATEGREIYREVKLMQAINLMNEKKMIEAMKFISEARQWPHNLGAGKPYQEDVDERLEDFLTAVCLQSLNKPSEAASYLEKIKQFKPGWFYDKTNDFVQAFVVEKQAPDRLQTSALFADERMKRWAETLVSGISDTTPAPQKTSGMRLIEKTYKSGWLK